VGDRITDVAGSSDYFIGSIVAYSYEAKERLLGVRHDTLYTHGAVSGETALEMARGARHALGADVALAVTGIAGPGGGLPDKPVGTTWVAVSGQDGDAVERFLWSATVRSIKRSRRRLHWRSYSVCGEGQVSEQSRWRGFEADGRVRVYGLCRRRVRVRE
jgi:PncC family amidohydrolase